MNQVPQNSTLLTAVNEASSRWKMAFNTGDAAGCTAQYEASAIMQAIPFGTFTGHAEIQAFWQQLIDDGFSDVEYIEPKIEVLDATTAVLSSKWKMNKAHGVIHKELWVLQADGTAKLKEDRFEAQG
ncbi:isochorismatase [Leptothoe sp. LEGE 181152]|uniref:Isochorismatase n=1 Tax=Adonisia turfae CCMR0081 TaxID=2292702 RepID=A0A6M0RHN6_9CYAN|nr:isochorismatase [Adonisia turfae]MDV3352988.1 isochorismatase [Leptothoe sp. LEGE 181152]NEZ55131.1 isochorismatase [Adonisia turfae CCMR0081]